MTTSRAKYEEILLSLKECHPLSTLVRLAVSREPGLFASNNALGLERTPTASQIKAAVEGASKNPREFEGLKRAIAMRMRLNRPVPDELSAWLSGYLLGEIEKPKAARGPDPIYGFFGRMAVATVVAHAVSAGLKPTRGRVSPAVSGCDAVVDILASYDHHVTYERIEKMWADAAPHHSTVILLPSFLRGSEE